MKVFIYNNILYCMNNIKYMKQYNDIIKLPHGYDYKAKKVCDFCKATNCVVTMFVKFFARNQPMLCYYYCPTCKDLASANVTSYDFNQRFPNFYNLYNRKLKVMRTEIGSSYIIESGWVLFDCTPIYYNDEYMVEVYKDPMINLNSTCQLYNMKLLVTVDSLLQLNG